MNQPRHVKQGDSGYDITAYKRALNAMRSDPDLLAGPNWPTLTGFTALRKSGYDDDMGKAVDAVKHRHPFITERGLGDQTFSVLVPRIDGWGAKLLLLARPKFPCDPLGGRGELIGRPYSGTHDHPDPTDSKHNWESCNAIDLARTAGSPVYAISDGSIGSQIGALQSDDPTLLGLRLHLTSSDGKQEWYYAHLSRLSVKAGDRVKIGQVLGFSGTANGVEHLHLGQKHGDPGITTGDLTPGYHDRGYPG